MEDKLKEAQKKFNKRVKKLKRKKTLFNFGSIKKEHALHLTSVSGKPILHKTKRHRRVGAMKGALHSEAVEIYLTGRY